MTEWQRYIHARSREAVDLLCSRCGAEPPRHAGGLCDDCSRDTPGGGPGDDGGSPAAALHRRPANFAADSPAIFPSTAPAMSPEPPA